MEKSEMEDFPQQLSFEEFAQQFSQLLLRYLQRYVGDRVAADDLLQETLIRIARGFSDFAGRASMKTWAFSIATRVAADYFRNPDHRRHIVEVSEADDLPGTDLPIDERIVVDEMNTCVRQVVDSLPDDYRAALVLHDLEGLTVEQTAAICGCSLATVKIRIHRARQRLRKALQQQCEFYRDTDSVLRCDRKP
jgi:RNA polymerase sigma-70 factor (ECF subfamily)